MVGPFLSGFTEHPVGLYNSSQFSKVEKEKQMANEKEFLPCLEDLFVPLVLSFGIDPTRPLYAKNKTVF